MKSGDHLYCDLSSKDQWLDVSLQLLELRLCLFFEVKVVNQARVSELLNMLVSISNLFLESNEIDIKYEVADLKIEKRLPDKEVKLTRGGQLEFAPASDSQTVPLLYDEDTRIEHCFTFLDRKVACQFLRGRANAEKFGGTETPYMVMCDTEGVETDITKLRAFPIRYFRKESLPLLNSTFELQADDKADGQGRSLWCCCNLW